MVGLRLGSLAEQSRVGIHHQCKHRNLNQRRMFHSLWDNLRPISVLLPMGIFQGTLLVGIPGSPDSCGVDWQGTTRRSHRMTPSLEMVEIDSLHPISELSMPALQPQQEVRHRFLPARTCWRFLVQLVLQRCRLMMGLFRTGCCSSQSVLPLVLFPERTSGCCRVLGTPLHSQAWYLLRSRRLVPVRGGFLLG